MENYIGNMITVVDIRKHDLNAYTKCKEGVTMRKLNDDEKSVESEQSVEKFNYRYRGNFYINQLRFCKFS